MSLPRRVAQIADKQGWNDDTMLDLAMDFIGESPDGYEPFIAFLEKIAKEEEDEK